MQSTKLPLRSLAGGYDGKTQWSTQKIVMLWHLMVKAVLIIILGPSCKLWSFLDMPSCICVGCVLRVQLSLIITFSSIRPSLHVKGIMK